MRTESILLKRRLSLAGILIATAVMWSAGPARADEMPVPAPGGGFPKLPPGLPSLPAGSKWKEIPSTDPATVCADGAPYGFFIREGDPDKLLIDFTGGGACGDAVGCDTSKEPTFFKDLSITRLLIDGGYGLGMFNADHENNPIDGWTHFVVPNCTGDLNVGDAKVTYKRADGTTFVTNHRGAPNTRAALAWLEGRYKDSGKAPGQVVVVGSSAGAYGAIVWTPAVREAFPTASLRQFSDSGAGVGDDARGAFLPIWNPTASYPKWIPGLNPANGDVGKLGLNAIYKIEAAFYPQVEFAQFNYNHDQIQSFFVRAGGGDPQQWTHGLYLKMGDLIATVPNFHSFIAEGTEHAVLVLPGMYDLVTNDEPFTSWFSDYINGLPPHNVTANESPQDGSSPGPWPT